MATNDDQQMEANLLNAEGDYEQLLDDYSHFAPPAEGELLQGHVLKVTDKEALRFLCCLNIAPMRQRVLLRRFAGKMSCWNGGLICE